MKGKRIFFVSTSVSVFLSLAFLIVLGVTHPQILMQSESRFVERALELYGGLLRKTGNESWLTDHEPQDASHEVREAYGELPLYFIENTGQVDGRVKFYEKSGGRTMFFTEDGMYVDLYRKEKESEKRQVVKLGFVGARDGVDVSSEGEQGGKVNYFIGNDPEKWKTDISTYSSVVYKDVYSGVDVKFYGNNRQLEYDVVVKSGANPDDVRFEYGGVEGIEIGDGGELKINLGNGEALEQKKPVVYQKVGGKKVDVEGNYRIYGKYAYGFEVGEYDRSRELTIDPVLVYSTFLGGSENDRGTDIAVDSSGNAYVTGDTSSLNFPRTTEAFNDGLNGGSDVFITKLNASGSALIYSTFLGGSGNEGSLLVDIDIAVDSSGNVYVTGRTGSADFPTTTGAFDTKLNGDDAFITKLNASGSALIYSTFLGGSIGQDSGFGIAVDSSGNAYVTGLTDSTDFPTTDGAFRTTLNRRDDAFITKLDASGSALVYSTFLGGGRFDIGFSIDVDLSGNVYVTGHTDSTDFPTTTGAFDTTPNLFGGELITGDAFITKLNASGSTLIYSTYLGGENTEGFDTMDIAVDSSGSAYVTGQTISTDFPMTDGAFDTTHNGDFDAFITKLNASGSALIYSTFLGGSRADGGNSIAVDSSRNVYVTGSTQSANFPTTPGAFGVAANGLSEVFVSQISLVTCNGVTPTTIGTVGDDVIFGTIGVDIIHGLAGDDIITGLGNNDVICGGAGFDFLNGGSGDDLVIGNSEDDAINGGSGDDLLFGDRDGDTINGGSGDDLIIGGGDGDTISGGLGEDQMFGGGGNDTLNGNPGNDDLFGGGGDDRLDGGLDDDTCSGGNGDADSAANCEIVTRVP